MTGRLVTEKMQWEKTVGTGNVRTVAEGMVQTENGERGVRVLQVTARPVIRSAEAMDEEVTVRGDAEMVVLYLTQGGEMGSCRTKAGFETRMAMEDAKTGQSVEAMATVEAIDLVQRGGRMEIAAEIALQALVTEKGGSAAVDVEVEGEMERRRGMVRALHSLPTVTGKERYAQSFAVAAQGMERVAWVKESAQVDNVLVLDGAVEVRGQAELACMLVGEGTQPEMQRVKVPFELEILGNGFGEGVLAQVKASVREPRVWLQLPMQEDAQAMLDVEFEVEVTAKGTETVEEEVLMDAYPLGEMAFAAQMQEMEYISAEETMEQTQVVETVLELPAEEGAIRRIVGAFATPLALEVTEGEQGLQAEGLLRVALLYESESEQAGFAVYEQEVPFGVAFDEKFAGAQLWQLEIGEVEAQRLSPVQAQVHIKLEMEAVRRGQERVQTMKEVSFEGEEKQLPVGIVLYYPEEGETLWDVGKRYRVKEELLEKYNAEGKVPVMVYRRLTAF